MQLSVIAFTKRGEALACRIKEQMQGEISCQLYTKCGASREQENTFSGEDGEVITVKESLEEWTRIRFSEGSPLLFIGACGIAVRTIAPSLRDKLTDVPVLVMDESGRYVIPILSGHYGGANTLARQIAERLSASPVITTATDVNGHFAVDVFAKKNELVIANREGIAKVSATLLEQGHITMQLSGTYEGTVPADVKLVSSDASVWEGDNSPEIHVDVGTGKALEFTPFLWLIPRQIVLGMGCRRGKSEAEIEAFVKTQLELLGIPMEAVCALSTIDRKSDEAGFLSFAKKHGLKFVCYPAEKLKNIPGEFYGSDFVKQQVGVDNVCERAAMAAAGADAKMLLKKCAKDGMTLSVAERQWRVKFDET